MERGIYEIVDTESLVPAEHLLRKIDAAINWNKLYDMVEPLYCEDNGRPSIDPVVLFKMVLIQHLYGLPSLRRTAEEVSLNVAYRWFLGYRLQEETPHFSTISYNFKHRFTPETVNQIFDWILSEIAEAGYLYTYTVFVDGTHIKANANNKKVVKEEVEVEAKRYAEELMEEVNADRIAHGKKYVYDEYYDCIICPEYQILKYSTTNRDGYREYKSNPQVCANCPTRALCTRNKDFINAAQLEEMFKIFKGDPAEFGVIAASFYGLRRSEVLGLRWDAIDFEEKTITIRHTVNETRIDGKYTLVLADTTKTKSSYRTLPLVAPFEAILKRMKAEQEENRKLCGNCYCQDYLGYIYVNELGELIKPGYLSSHVPAVLKEHNMPPIRFHDLRHSCASLLFSQGVSLKEIQAWLGHSTIGTTANIYTHLDENNKLSSANAILSILPEK